MNLIFSLLLCATILTGAVWTKDCASLKSNTKLFCYYGEIKDSNGYCKCTHVILPENTEAKIVEKIRKQNGDVKILITVREFNEKLVQLLKGTKVDGVELNLKKIESKNDMSDFISTVKSKLGPSLYVAVAVPPKTELIAKYFDFKELAKNSDAFVLNTAFLGASRNVTFHPSRLSGLWDMQNTDSMVDLVSGLGAPLSKLVITAPVQAYKFTLQSEEYTAPGSPATEVQSIDRNQLCEKMRKKGEEWTLERDQDQAGAYIFRGKEWISFEDETSIDIKTKYARVRSLGGVALKDLSQDFETKCGPSILEAAFKGLSKQARAPRAAVLHTLEREILSTNPGANGGSVHASPFRITRVIDTEGKIHVIRQDTRTEFECSRQGYFVHPRSCNRFYRCVKFDQRTDEYNVFEFDCPAGLTFDEKTEVCVWPGSIPHSSACSGSSEIAPVPQKRFTCPTEPGYYADPENCRWFFACLDHGEASMQAYEFRCPFGLVFDEEKLLCEWSWLVPKCGLGVGTVTVDFYGGALTDINQYDGLGVLQTVKLGGLLGHIPVAESKTYSNVGLVGSADKILNHNLIIGENSAQFIDASRRLGLSLKATQSLYNAGLLNSDLSATILKQTQGTFNLGGLAGEINSGLSDTQLNLNNLGVGGAQIQGGQYYQNSNSRSNQYESVANKDSFVSLGVNQGASLGAIQGSQTVSLNTGLQENLGRSNVFNFGRSQVSLYSEGALNVGVPGQYQNIDAHNSDGSLVLAQNVGTQFGSRIITSNLNQHSVGGKGLNENIQIIQNSAPIDGIQQVTPASVSYTTASSFDSLASATPLRTIENHKQNIALELSQDVLNQGPSIEFGDIKKNLDIIQPVVSGATFQFVQNNQQNDVSSTVSPIAVQPVHINVKQSNIYSKPQVLLEQPEVHLSSIRPVLQQTYVQPISAVKPVTFATQTVSSAVSENRPQVTFKQPLVSLTSAGEQGILSGSGISQHQGYTYDKPSVVFEEKPQAIISSTPSTLISESLATPSSEISYSYTEDQNSRRPHVVLPQVFVGSTPATATSSYHRQDINSGIVYKAPQVIQRQPQAFVASTVTPLVKQEVLLSDNYIKPQVQILGEPQVLLKQPQGVSTSYSYDASKIRLDQPQILIEKPKIIERYTYNKPAVQQELVFQQPQVPITGSSYSFAKQENGGYKYEKPIVAFEEKPRVVLQPQPQIIVSSTPATSNYHRQDVSSDVYETPKVYQQPIQGFVSSTFTPFIQQKSASTSTYIQPQQQILQSVVAKIPQAVVTTYSKPVVQSEIRQDILLSKPQVVVRPQKVVESYSFVKPVAAQQPQIFIASTETPIIQQTLVEPSISQTFTYSNQDSNPGYKYEKPQVVFEEKPQINYAKPFVSTSYNVNSGYKYEKPSVILQEQPQVILQKQPQVIVSSTPATSSYHRQDINRYVYETPKVVSTNSYVKPQLQILEQEPIIAKVPQEVVSLYSKPEIQFEQRPKVLVTQPQVVVKPQKPIESYSFVKPVVREQVVIQQPQVYVSSTQTPILQQTIIKPSVSQSVTYSEQNSNSGYKYEKPRVIFEEKPQTYLNYARPSFSTSFNVNTGYKYDRPSVIFEEKPQVHVKQQIVQPIVSYKQVIKQQEPTVYRYEPVPVVQQPRGFSKVDFQEAAVQSYSYSSPTQPQYIVKPASILSTTYRSPVAVKTQNIEFRGYGYPRPQVQFVEEREPVVTSYENKIPVVETPIIPKKAYVTGGGYYYRNNVQTVKQKQPVQFYSTPRPTYASTISSIVTQKKTVEVPRQEVVYYDSRLENPNIQTQYFQYSPSVTPKVVNYDYPKPQIQFYDRPRQKLVPLVKETAPQGISYTYSTPRPTYLSTVQSVVRQKIQPIQQNFVYYDSRLSTTPASQIQYLESTTVRPVATVTASYLPPVVQNVEKVETTGYIHSKPKVNFYEYKNEAVIPQKQYVTENYVNRQYIEPKIQISYKTTAKPRYQSTLVAAIPQKLEPFSPAFTYYDSRYITQSPKIQYVETSTLSAPVVTKIKKVQFNGYEYPKPQVKFEEEKFVVSNYEDKLPVKEVPIIPKKAYVTTGQSYTYNQKTDVDVKPIVLEDYVAANYQEYSSTPKQEVFYSSSEPTYTSTIATLLAEKLSPIKPDFVYYDTRLSSTSKPVQYQERIKTPTRVAVTFPEAHRVDYGGNDQKVQYLEQPKQVLTKVEINQPSIIESYVSPEYQKYDSPLQTSTLSSVVSQNIQPIKQEVLYYDSRLSTPKLNRVKVSRIQPNIEITTPSPVVIQKLEQEVPVEPFYYFDSRLSSTQAPNVEIAQKQEIVPQLIEQEVIDVNSGYSTTVNPSLEPVVEIEYRPRVKIVKQKKLFRPATSTPKSGVVYAEIETKEPSSTYLPIRKRIKSTTQPSREYLPTRTTFRPSVQYLPSSTTTVSNEYLPVFSSESPAADGISVENYENFELVRKKSRPVKVVKIVRPRVKTVVIKKNDFNPFLSAKLGAQCTCTSNTLELRKSPLKIEVPDYYDGENSQDDDDDDAVIVTKNDGDTIVVENYEAQPEDDSVTPEPEIYVKSSTVEIPSSTYKVKKVNRGRSRAQNVFIEGIASRKTGRVDIEASEVSISAPRVKVKTPRVDIKVEEGSEVSVKSRSRVKYVEVEDNDVQVTGLNPQNIDCQRAGLFRHPTQCNKFYSCRWDCKKNKFTLHVFNCPVHLTFDNNLGACNWPSQGPACLENTLLPSE